MIAVALSGGVDSALAAHLLRRQGEVFGLFALLAPRDPEREVHRVRRLCERLSIPLEVLDLRDEFQRIVVSYFKESYRRARTPNPCVICNRHVKFGLLLRRALSLGAERLATGHYVRLVRRGDCLFVARGRDRGKDQSYFLSLLGQEELHRTVFPLGEWTKEEVVRKAVRLGLFEITAPESQEVCFVRGDYRALFADEEFPPGDIVTVSGRVVGRHRGLFAYTIGQRRGLGVRLGRPYYVVALDPERNRVVIGPRRALEQREMLTERVHWVCPAEPPPAEAEVRLRYRHRCAPASLVPLGEGRLRVVFRRPQTAVTPGQFAVFYRDEAVIGAAEIDRPGSGGEGAKERP